MAEEYKAGYPLAPANNYSRSDEEAFGAATSSKRCRKKWKKCLLYGVAFAIFQTGIIVLFTLTVMKVWTPKFRLQSANVFNVQTTTTPSYNLTMNTVLAIKNTNFGPYKYDNTTVYFYHRGIQVGSAFIPESKASFRSTKKVKVAVNLVSPTNLASNSQMATDISSGVLPLTSQSELNGKVELMLVLKKKKAIDLNCTMDVVVSSQELQTVQCNW